MILPNIYLLGIDLYQSWHHSKHKNKKQIIRIHKRKQKILYLSIWVWAVDPIHCVWKDEISDWLVNQVPQMPQWGWMMDDGWWYANSYFFASNFWPKWPSQNDLPGGSTHTTDAIDRSIVIDVLGTPAVPVTCVLLLSSPPYCACKHGR